MEDDDDIQLSEQAQLALEEFYKEREEKILSYNDKNSLIEEDWELSQFWYDDVTADTLAKSAVKAAGQSGKLACISCPTVYECLKRIIPESTNCYLFEYDKRFQEKFPEYYIFYDYNAPLKVSQKFKLYFDIVLVDPPYLSQECMEKIAETVKFIAKDKIILCTGAVMEECARKLLGLNTCNFIPQHRRNLGNEFRCYTNWKLDDVINQMRDS